MEPIPPIPVVSAVQRIEAAPARRTPEERALILSIADAARTLNAVSYSGQDREITFTFDRVTRRPVVSIVDRQTREVLNQWPSAYLLEVAGEQAKRRTR